MKTKLLTPLLATAAIVVALAAYAKQAEAPKPAAGSESAAPAAAPAAAEPAADAAELPLPRPAPKWNLQDVHGQAISSETFKGKVVVVDFWATWCGPCVSEIPGYVELQKKYGKDGLVIVGVSLDQAGPKVVEDFVKKHGMNYQIVMGDDDVAAAFGGMNAIPTTFLIDRNGQIRDKKVGAEPAAEYEKKVTALLN